MQRSAVLGVAVACVVSWPLGAQGQDLPTRIPPTEVTTEPADETQPDAAADGDVVEAPVRLEAGSTSGALDSHSMEAINDAPAAAPVAPAVPHEQVVPTQVPHAPLPEPRASFAGANPRLEREPLPPAPYRRGGIYGMGLGGGAWFTYGDTDAESHAGLTVAFDIKWTHSFNDYVGFEILFNGALWDYARVGRAYEWYFEDASAVGERVGTLWFGLFLAPLIGCHMILGPQLVVFSGGSTPAWWFDLGPAVSWFLRPSDGRALLGLGTQYGTGVDLTDDIALALRFVWSPAPINSILAENSTNAMSFMLTLNVIDP